VEIEVTVVGQLNVVRAVVANATFPMLLTLLGIYTPVNEEQL